MRVYNPVLTTKERSSPSINVGKSSRTLQERGKEPDLKKAASGASGACRHFVRNHAVLRTF